MLLKVSVIIPTYNRPKALKSCLDALSLQQVSEAWEVVVIDDGGKPDLNELIQSFTEHLNIQFKRQENSGPAKARNYGASIAKGEYLAFLDDDCEPSSKWLTNLLEQAEPKKMIGGKTENSLQDNPYSESSQLIVSFLIRYFSETPWWFFTSNNLLVDRDSYLQIGGFNASFATSAGEDREFCAKWLNSGFQMEYEATAVIQHLHDLSLRSFWKMHRKYGRASNAYHKALQNLGIQPIPFRIAFYWKLLTYPWKAVEAKFLFKVRLSVLIFLSQIAIMSGFVTSRFYKNEGA